MLDPIPTTGLTAADVDELTNNIRELMLKEMVALTAQVRGSAVPIPADSQKNGSIKASGTDVKKS